MITMYKLICLMAISMASYKNPLPNKFAPPKWEGHWEAFSEKNPDLTIATLDITKVKGKEYSWKLIVKNDLKLFEDDPACPKMEYEGTAIYNGVNGLDSGIGGIGFTYYQDTDLINVFHDYTDERLIEYSLCFDPGSFKRIKH